MINGLINNRIKTLRSFGATENEITELLKYNENIFNKQASGCTSSNKDEVFITDWEKYIKQLNTVGSIEVLKKIFIELNFPIQKGISQSREYRTAKEEGILPGNLPENQLLQPELINIYIYKTSAGKIPIIEVNNRKDFENIIRAISKKNEPVEIPGSQGAAIFSGYNNWNRINTYKHNYLEKHTADEWDSEFDRFIEQKHLYKDSFIILSNSYYSGISPKTVGLSNEEWKEKSLIIRREHECTHYFVKRVFGSMRNNIYDEILADFAGLVSAFGKFDSKKFLLFLGLENFPDYRENGRLEIYRGELKGHSFTVVQKMIIRAAENLEIFWNKVRAHETIEDVVSRLTKLTLEELASGELE